MFKKTERNPQLDMFASPVMQLCNRASKKYTDPKAWQNMFFRLVTSKVDESPFEVLFPVGKKSGRPNASIQVLVAMSALKEGFGCSDEELFEKCDFDILNKGDWQLRHSGGQTRLYSSPAASEERVFPREDCPTSLVSLFETAPGVQGHGDGGRSQVELHKRHRQDTLKV